MALVLVREDEIRYNKNRYTIKCRLCESYKTKLKTNGEPIWIKDKNSRGEWTNQFICYSCAYENDKSCHKCGNDTDKYNTKYYDNKEIWTGKYICDSCQQKEVDEYRSRHIRLKIGYGKGSVGDEIISKILEIPVCTIHAGDIRLPFGLIHGYYGIVGVKIASSRKGRWDFGANGRITADTYFYLGFSEDYKDIEIVYIIPSEILENSSGRLCVYKNSKKYLNYNVDSKPYNDIYHSMTKNVDIQVLNNRIQNTIMA